MLRKLAVLALVLAACGGGETEDTTTSSTPTTEPPASTTTPEPGVTPPTYLDDELVDRVRQLASDESGIEPDAFEVETATEVTWSDGSLGCPQPGQSYTQALVDGYWVVLTHEGETFDFRSGADGDFHRCLDGAPPMEIYDE